MGNNPFLFPSTVSYSQPSLPSSPSFNSYIPSPSPSLSFDSYSPSSPSLNSPFQFYQSLPSPPSQISSNHFGTPSADAVGPCAACTILHRRCTDKCYLASYFPQGVEPHNFTVVDSLFGLSNVVELLQQNKPILCLTVPLIIVVGGETQVKMEVNSSKSQQDLAILLQLANSSLILMANPCLPILKNSKASHSYNSSSKPPMMVWN
ncbi:LOB domain-containing protein 28 [Jatropha curcas]|uniref:LOB domain-containing protein 28 n=1 Tax=Jatropha curcas TaxID=180498 RepID=UPI001892FB59|nr:LOB domain-containing protein 28 [Jatropha curcas]